VRERTGPREHIESNKRDLTHPHAKTARASGPLRLHHAHTAADKCVCERERESGRESERKKERGRQAKKEKEEERERVPLLNQLTHRLAQTARASGALRLHAAPAVPIKQYNPKFEESFAPEQVLVPPEREFCVDNLLVRIHLIIIRPCVMGVELPFAGSRISAFLVQPPN